MTISAGGGAVHSRSSIPAQYARQITPHDTNPNQANKLLILVGTTPGDITIRALNDTADVAITLPAAGSFFELGISVAFVRATGTNLGTGGKVYGLD